MQWFDEKDDVSMKCLHNAFENDRQTGVSISVIVITDVNE
jgi:hypothetical protein